MKVILRPELGKLARQHNDANICSLPARFIDNTTAAEIVDLFLATPFEGGRHCARIAKIPVQAWVDMQKEKK